MSFASNKGGKVSVVTTHDDNLSGGSGAQDDPPRIGFLMSLETEHAYTERKKK